MILIGSLLVCGGLPVFAASIPDQVKALKSVNAQTRLQAMDALLAAGPAAVPELLRGMDNRRRLSVLAVLTKMGRPGVDKLMDMLKDPKLRDSAGGALFQVITPDSRAHIPGLIKCLKDPNLKSYCGQALAKVVDEKAAGRAPALLEALKSKDADVRMYAATALGQIGLKGEAAVPELILALGDKQAVVRLAAAVALGKIGSAAAAPALEQAVKDPDAQVGREAAEALKKIRA